MSTIQSVAVIIGALGAFISIFLVLWSHHQIAKYTDAGRPPSPNDQTALRMGLYAALVSFVLLGLGLGSRFLITQLSTISWFG